MSDAAEAVTDLPDPLALVEPALVVKRVDRAAEFPSRGAATQDGFHADGVRLRPLACTLGSAGSRPTAVGSRAAGVWRGSVTEAPSAADAAARVADMLRGTIALDCLGTFASTELPALALRFVEVRMAMGVDEATEEDLTKAAAVFGGAPQAVFECTGLPGQIMTHAADLWIRPAEMASEFDLLLRLRPLRRATSGGTCFRIARRGPLGTDSQTWQEVAMVELPKLLRISMASAGGGGARASVPGPLAVAAGGKSFLVDEEEEALTIRCWCRRSDSSLTPDGTLPVQPSAGEALTIEQLLWFDTIAALAASAPCAEAAVPSARVALADEGLATRAELLGDVKEHDVPKEDAPRLASLVFLRQSADREVIEDEVLPRLLPGSGTVRVFSAELVEVAGASKQPEIASKPKPRSLDDLFSDDVDFRTPAPWATKADSEDPLVHHDLTSVFLVNENVGFVLAFHCLQGRDPLAS